MSDRVLVGFDIPTKAEKLPEVKKLLDSLDYYELDNVSQYTAEKKGITSYQFFDSSNYMHGMHDILDTLVPANIPFDMWQESYLDCPEVHYMFRKGMKEPYEYSGSEPSVPVDVLRDIIKNDPDYTREHLIEYLDANFPDIPDLEKATKEWEKEHSLSASR